MSVRVALAAVLADLIGGRRYLDVEGATVDEVLHNLSGEHEALAHLLWKESGEFNPILVVFLNKQVIRAGQGMDSPVKPGDQIAIISSLGGG